MIDGSVYVSVPYEPVEAYAASPYAVRSTGSSGSVTGSFRIDWAFDGGISGEGWTIPPKKKFPPLTITPVPGDVEATNKAISDALSGKNYYYVDYILTEWYCGETL